MMWNGKDIAQEWKEHPSFDYHEFARLEMTNENDKIIIKDYWLG